MLDVICFGAASGGIRLYDKISKKYNILAYTDNDTKKMGWKDIRNRYIIGRRRFEIRF